MSVSQPPRDTPFGLDANLAAGLAYLVPILGGIVMMLGGGTNRFVRWAASQSIVLWVSWIVLCWAINAAFIGMNFWFMLFQLWVVLRIVALFLWLWTFITAFQGKEVRVPIVADLTRNLFKSYLQ